MTPLFLRKGPLPSLLPGSMSTNFSPKSVLGLIVAVEPTGIFWPLCRAMCTSASPSTRCTLVTKPMLSPWTFTSEPVCRPWPAAVNLAFRWYLGESFPEPRYTPKTVTLAKKTRLMSPVMIRTRRSDNCAPPCCRLARDPDRVAPTPEDKRQDEVEDHHGDDAEADGPAHRHANALGPARR